MTHSDARRALVLNAAGSWGAYQMGALRYMGDMGITFQGYAGTGTGAMNAALAACGELESMEGWWREAGLRRQLAINFRAPWRKGPLLATSQRRFLAAYVSEEKLRQHRTTLMISLLDLQNGKEHMLTYPGAPMPLLDALVASISTPGLYPPLVYRGHQLVSGSLANNFLLPKVRRQPFGELFVVAAVIPKRGATRVYTTALSALQRNIAMSQAHDVRQGLAAAEQAAQAAAAFAHVRWSVHALATNVEDPQMRGLLESRLSDIYAPTSAISRVPAITAITPSGELDFPPWRFRSADLAHAQEMGYNDAHAAMSQATGSG